MLKLIRVRHLLAVAAILFAMAAGHHALHMTEGLEGGLNDRPLASAEYRAPVARLEARLFAPAPLSMEERLRVAAAFEDLKKTLEAGSQSHLSRFSARELGTLAAMSRGLGDLGGEDLDRVRTNWLRVRSNTFDDASWFRFSEADPAAAEHETRTSLGEVDRATCTRLGTVLARIDDLIPRGERDAERLGEPANDGSTSQAMLDSWRLWDDGWRSEIESIRRGLPDKPSVDAPVAVRAAYDATNVALEQLAAVNDEGIRRAPYRVEWTRRFVEARRDVRNARDWIARAQSGTAI